MSFDSLGLSKFLLEAIDEKGYSEPTPIQAEAIPAVISGKDVMAAAQTGTGKTAGFTLPLLEILSKGENSRDKQIRALVLTPTRELAAQVEESVTTYGKNLPLRSTVVFGGVKIKPQINRLRQGADILVATPGRLLDLFEQGAVRFKQLEVLILDEADRMLDMGFIHDIKKILSILPKKRQNLMFSATFSKEIRKLAKKLVHDPIEISVTPRNTTVEAINQVVHPVTKNKKTGLLIHLIKENNWKQVLVFTKTKHGANRLTKNLISKKITALPIHGNKSQGARTRALAEFKAGEIRVLVATDIAARGLDIDQLPHVVNYDLPNVPEDYIHRIGRTGRAGREGEAASLVASDEIKLLKAIERVTKQMIPKVVVDGFDPTIQSDRENEERRLRPSRPSGKSKSSSSKSSRSRNGFSGNKRKDEKKIGYKFRSKKKSGFKKKV